MCTLPVQYRSTQVESDVWIKRAINHEGGPYYKFMLIYVDDVLHITEDPTEDMEKIRKVIRPKGGNVERVQLRDGPVGWSLSCHNYLMSSIEEIERGLRENGRTVKHFGTGSRPYPSSCRQEMVCFICIVNIKIET